MCGISKDMVLRANKKTIQYFENIDLLGDKCVSHGKTSPSDDIDVSVVSFGETITGKVSIKKMNKSFGELFESYAKKL